jgi:hypothetical protein
MMTSTKRNQQKDKGPKKVSSQSFAANTSKPPEPPKPLEPPINQATIQHNPGVISQQKLIDAKSNTNPVEDIITARVAGTDHTTGQVIVTDGGGNKYNVQVGVSAISSSISPSGRSASFPSIVVGQSVIISRSRSQSGERTVRLLSVVPLTADPSDFLSNFAGRGNINELCTPTQNATVISGVRAPRPPEDPEDQEEPAPENPEQRPNDDPEDDPPSKPFGCNPKDDAQWYNGEGCPAGMRSLGFATLSDGGTKTLCKGANPPPGDGCPETPDEYGWICVRSENNGQLSESCEFVPNGLYATKAECEGACVCSDCGDPDEDPDDPEAPLRFDCSGGDCIASPTGTYATLEACETACVETWDRPEGNVGPCDSVVGPGGEFTSQGDCNESTGQCPNRTYRIDMSLSWTAFNPVTGEVEPFSFNGGPNFSTPVGIADKLEGPLSGATLSFYKNTFFPFQEKAGFNIVINGSNGFYRWNRGAPFTGNGGYIVSGPTFSATIFPNNPSTPCN